ncbi:MAG: EAL domain-containing protein [Marinobacter sp.]|nr:EAL domain-containing protein [Marinobacter sp.]
MKLAEFIQTETEQLLEDWAEAAMTIAPELRGEDNRVLEDHARAMLKFITEDLLKPETDLESARKAVGEGIFPASKAAENHGSERHSQGFSMLQMIQELRALRARVMKAWGDEQQGLTTKDIDELLRFNEAIDQLIANSVASYSLRKEQETRLFEAMLKVSPDPSAIFDSEAKLLLLNTPMAELANTTAGEAVGKTPLELDLESGFAQELHNTIAATVATGQFQRREIFCPSPSGHELYFDCQLAPVFDDRNAVEAVAKTSRDITERKLAEYQVWQSANFDSLTNLPNRRLFLDRLEQTLLEAERKGSSFALLFVDLDRFKQANDQLGHRSGDRLLEQVAERISTNVRAMDTFARLGGDEFTLILKDTDRDGAMEAARSLLATLEGTFHVDAHKLHISGSIGATLYPDHGTNGDQLMHNADQAMYASKENGGQQVQMYESWMAYSESEHMKLNRELDEALRENQLNVYYQPIIDLRNGTISGAEALLRWNHPRKGLLTPASFLSVTEQSGITNSINTYVMDQAVTCSHRWRNMNDEAFPININESPASFFTRTLVDQWRGRLAASDLDGSRITMELTPASLNNIRASGLNPFQSFALTGLRLHLSIDEFGIEPFSLFAIQEFKMDSVKIDRELIKNAGQGGDADRILEAIVAMAHAIDVQVVAVGVENDEQFQFLSSAGCDHAQGFLFSEPLNQENFEELLRRQYQIKSC